MCTAADHANSQKPLDKPACFSMAVALSSMVRLHCLALPCDCGEPGIVRWCSIPLSFRMSCTVWTWSGMDQLSRCERLEGSLMFVWFWTERRVGVCIYPLHTH